MTTTKTSDMLELAAQCAREHRAQGWQGGGGEYDIGVYYGDAEVLNELLGRPLTRADRVDFERMIRACLNAPGGYRAAR